MLLVFGTFPFSFLSMVVYIKMFLLSALLFFDSFRTKDEMRRMVLETANTVRKSGVKGEKIAKMRFTV